ncbi:GlsB/YeaQ/YmgE family stress response membrane protein [Opitutia bacterium ISCC 51]|nr:GlsB/YeaQ/YmgE family stress response membrane protein [Opitutae bacterium ISCC 51]QXD26671.1 GlsB/YeaQ/YmgE family stress response membrane protein [Opitutae bacterium ISCC 52]
MELEQLFVTLLIGAIAGWLAGQLTKGGGFGIIKNIILGIVGAVVGGCLFGLIGISIGGEWIGPIITASVGALVLIFVVGLVTKKK